MRAWLHGFTGSFTARLDLEAGRLGVRRRELALVSALVWIFVLALLLVPFVAQAQVAGLCGPGKACSAAKFTATGGASGTANVCVTGNNADWGWLASTSNFSLYSFTAGSKCSAAQTLKFNVNVNDAAVRPNNSNGWFSAPYGYDASLAFSSFPAAAGVTGRMLYDSTNATWRYSNGTSWFPVGPYNLSDEFVIYFPGLSALLNLPMSRWLAPRSIWLGGSYVSTFGTQIYSATTLVAGVGAGNAVFTIYNVSDAAATTATLTVPCAAAAGTVTASGSIDSSVVITTSAKTFELRLTTNGCTTLPTLNLNVRYTVLPPIN